MNAARTKILLQYLQIILVVAIVWICVATLKTCKESALFIKRNPPAMWSTEAKNFRNNNFVFECDDGRVGRSFNANFGHYLQNLRLLPGYEPKNYSTLTEFPAFVTAFSDNHLSEGLRLVEQITKYFPGRPLILYDLGLSKDNVKHILDKGNAHIVLKQFDFSTYRSDVSTLTEYRWKPIIIAQELVEYPAVLWMDSSVYWKNANIFEVLIRIKNKELFPWCMLDRTGHSTFAVTTPEMMDFLNCSKEKLYDLQLGANFMLIYRTPEIVENVLKWWILCALEPECMAPRGAQLRCQFPTDTVKTYAQCHRYDQSAINILLAKVTGFRGYQNYYHMPSFAEIVRGA